MATLHISKSTTVDKLRKEFNENFGSQVKLYKDQNVADGSVPLSELGLTNEGTFECRSSLTVASFIERMMNDFGLKVKVYTCDECVACLDGLTLESTGKVKKNAVKADMEDMIAYQRSAVVSANDSESPEVDAEDDEEAEDPIGECIVNNVSYDIFSDCAFAQYLDDDDVTSVTIPDSVEYEGKSYPVTYWGAGSESVTVVELGKNVKYVDALQADCENLKKIIVHSPKGFIEAEDLDNDRISLEKCYPGVEICYDSTSSSDQDCKSSIVYDRNFWVSKSSEENVNLIENAMELLNSVAQNQYQVKYNKLYIGITKDGKSTVFVSFTPQRTDLIISIKVAQTTAFDKIIADNFGAESIYKDGCYRVHVQPNNLDSLKPLFVQAEREFFNLTTPAPTPEPEPEETQDQTEKTKGGYDRNFWVSKSSEENVSLIENVLEMLNSVTQNQYQIKYNKLYIGLTKDGKPTVFSSFVPQRGDLMLNIKVSRSSDFDKILADKFDGQGGYKDGWYSIHVQTDDTEQKGGFFKKLLGKTASNLESLKPMFVQAEKEFFNK